MNKDFGYGSLGSQATIAHKGVLKKVLFEQPLGELEMMRPFRNRVMRACTGAVFMFRNLTVLLAICPLAACSDAGAELADNYMNVAETIESDNVVQNDVTAADEAVPQPDAEPVISLHRYAFKEGELYGYIAAISEEERKRGKAAEDVIMYRYRGFQDAVDRLEALDSSGRIIAYNECSRPCVAIKYNSYGRVERVAFNPRSVIGAAFEDAANGRLIAVRPPPPPKPTTETTYEPQEYQAAPEDTTTDEQINLAEERRGD